jgi:hypothetical protein
MARVSLTQLVLLPHGVDEVTGAETLVEGLAELLSSTVERTTETRTNGQKTRDEGTDKIFAGTSGDDGVHGTRHSRTVIGSQHEHHLEEAAGVVGQTTTEPEQRHDTTDTDLLPKDIGDGHTSVQQLLTTVIRDGGNESSWLSDETEFLCPCVVNGDLGYSGLGLGLDSSLLEELLVDLRKSVGHLLEGLRYVDTSFPHGLVLGRGSLELRVGERTSVTELHLSLEQAGDGTDGPRNNGLGDLARLHCLNHAVFLNTTDFTEQDDDLAVRVRLVSEDVVDKRGTGVPVTTNGNTLEHTIRSVCDDVVQLVGHATGLGNVGDGARAVELGGDNVVHHATSVTDLERAGPDTTDGSGADDGDALLLGNV